MVKNFQIHVYRIYEYIRIHKHTKSSTCSIAIGTKHKKAFSKKKEETSRRTNLQHP